MKLTGVSEKVFLDRYSLKDEKGNPTELTPEEMWRRVAKAISSVESTKEKKKEWEEKFFSAMRDFKFVPGGRVLAGAGTGYDVTFYNCFVIPSPKDSRDGIMDNLKSMIEIMARGGGVGVNISSLRPRGARVKKVNGFSSGPINWAGMYSLATHDIIQQGGCFSGDTLIMTHRGLVSVKDIVESKSIYFAATHQGYKKVTAKFDNGVKKLYEVKTVAGYTVKVTAEHRLVTVDKQGQFFLKKLADFTVGDTVVMLLGEWLDDIPYVILKTDLPKPSKYSYGLKQISLPSVFNEDLAFIIGAYDADGSKIPDEFSPNGKGIRIAAANDRPEDLQKLIAAIKRAFGLTPTLRKGDGAVTIVQVFSRRVNEFLKLNGLLKKSSVKVTVPEVIFTSPRTVVEAYIAGVFLRDGSNCGGKGGLHIATVSPEFAQSLQLLLLNMGIASKIKEQVRKEKNWRTIYTVTVNGATFMKKFLTFLASYTEKVFDKNISVRDGFFGWPFNVVERFAYVPHFQRIMARNNPTTSQKAALFLQEHTPVLQKADKTDVELLGNCIPDSISSITYVGKDKVYDLEVDSVHLLSGNGFYTSNSRRGALMLMLWDWHPDIEEFITVKQDLTRINGANLSVCVSDTFMEAVKKDEDWDLVFPDIEDPEYDLKWDGILDNWKKLGKKVKVHKTIKARHLWNLICEAAWRSAEPGLVFMERYNKWYNNWYWNTINCVNPCVTGDTLVSTTNGLQSMKKLYGKGTPFRIVVDGKNYLSTNVKLTGVKPVYRLRTSEGYELRLTKDHTVFTAEGKKEAGLLQRGEKLLLSKGGSFGTAGTIEEGRVLGWLVGDGSMKEDVATLFFYRKEKQELAPRFALMVEKMVEGEQVVARPYPITPQYIDKEDKAVIESVRLWRIANRFGITHENKYVVPEKIFEGSEEFQRGFLQGLFSSDGSVQGTLQKGVSVRLTSVSRELLVDTQRLLLNFGIVSTLYENRRKQQDRLLPDGKGGLKSYNCKAYHELVISKTSLSQFAALIGFLQQEKQEKMRSLLSLYTRGPYTQYFTATFSYLEEDGIEEVFDITVADIHRFSANGVIVSNCGEEGLPAWGVCNLASLNLSAFVKGYSEDTPGEFDYESLAKHARIGVRFQDNVVDADRYIYPEIEKMQHFGERRIGLGTLGLADALIKMHLRYGSDGATAVVDKIYKTIRDAAYDESVAIAKEKGPFPRIKIEKHLQGHFIKQLPEEIKKKMKKYGVRNSMILQAAPTGTTSLLSSASSGIEPVYEFEYYHMGRLGKQLVYHNLYGEWRKLHPNEERPSYFVAANDLTPEDHVKVQATVQKYVDASISKTVNAPNSHTVEDVKKLYMMAYDMGCKGIAYMRDGSRQAIFERVSEKKPAPPVAPVVPFIPRPMMVKGVTYQVDSPVGKTYVTINHSDKNEPFEVFITNGKSGSDVAAMADALGRVISILLRLASPVPTRERMRKIVSELSGIGGARSVGFGQNKVRSLPDAIAKVIARYSNFQINGKVEDKEIAVNTSNGHTNGLNGHVELEGAKEEAQQLPLESMSMLDQSSTSLFDICPECGAGSLAFEEGCQKCYSCGYSAC